MTRVHDGGCAAVRPRFVLVDDQPDWPTVSSAVLYSSAARLAGVAGIASLISLFVIHGMPIASRAAATEQFPPPLALT